ncbi:MAG TPA: alpha-amylase, partial [Lamprocystis sp. (in: g-proteobacteria)]|nr:alpha-amylase [Lamprocystis sp. (in: g-proteobacteria)]
QTQAHPLYQHIKRLNQIRRAVPALQKAPMTRVAEWGSGMSFVRDLADAGSYAVIGLAIRSDQSVTVEGIPNGTYRDAVTGREVQVGGGCIQFQVRANSAGVYVRNGPGKVGEDGAYLR